MSDDTDRGAVVRSVLEEHGRLSTPVPDLGDDDSLFTAGLTSHASVNVMLALEDHFDIEFPERFLTRATFETIANLRAALDDMLVGA